MAEAWENSAMPEARSPKSEVRSPQSGEPDVASAVISFEDIHAWQKARTLVCEIYRTCNTDPLAKDWGLRNQISRAAVSVMSNIAEGFARKNDKEFARYLDIARASATEVQSLLYVMLDIGYMHKERFTALMALTRETLALIGGFTNYLRGKKS
jgi:four helix bundle protein